MPRLRAGTRSCSRLTPITPGSRTTSSTATTCPRSRAYLQTGQDAAAKRLLDALPEIAAHFDWDAITSAAPGMTGVFALAAIPARWALERHEWGEAVKLQPHPSRLPRTEAMTYFARALGPGRRCASSRRPW